MRISDWSSDVCSSDLGRIVEPGDGGIRRRVSSIHGHGQRGFPFALRRQSAGNVVCRMFRIGTREVEARTTNVPKLPNGFQLCKQYIQAHVLGCQVVRNDLEYHGFQVRSEEHTSELQSLMRISYAVFCLKK